MIDRGKHCILGVKVDAVDYDAAVDRIIDAAASGRPYAVSALAVHGVMSGVLDRAHRFRLNAFDLLTPDGQPVRWALNWIHGTRLASRVYGPDLMLETCRRAVERNLPIFLFGGTANTLVRLQEQLHRQFPALAIAGTRPSAFRSLTIAERDALVTEISGSGAALVIVGIGCPRQEVFAFEMRDALSMPVLAVGAAFSFHSGEQSQAPGWMQRNGLEWLFRLSREPFRLWKRYLLLNPLYVLLVILQGIGIFSVRSDNLKRPAEEVLCG